MSSPLPRTAPPGPLLPAGNPRIVGIVNITEDSFSDGGRYLDPAVAVTHARKLLTDGADIIELGPAASHPDSAPVSAAQERRRLAPVLEASDCRLIVMHTVQAAGAATRVLTDEAAVWDGTLRFLARRLAALQAAGIGRDRLVIDPGLGCFLGSTPGPSLAALAGIRELKDTFGVPVPVSPSRKSFLRALTGSDVTRSGPATLAAEIFAAWQGADYIRTHDVAAARDALTLLAAITREASHA
jgi:dihydropteroate synthase type 2